jgi:hypothetical protein
MYAIKQDGDTTEEPAGGIASEVSWREQRKVMVVVRACHRRELPKPWMRLWWSFSGVAHAMLLEAASTLQWSQRVWPRRPECDGTS